MLLAVANKRASRFGLPSIHDINCDIRIELQDSGNRRFSFDNRTADLGNRELSHGITVHEMRENIYRCSVFCVLPLFTVRNCIFAHAGENVAHERFCRTIPRVQTNISIGSVCCCES